MSIVVKVPEDIKKFEVIIDTEHYQKTLITPASLRQFVLWESRGYPHEIRNSD